ncbi:MAG: DUF502 domain-containing protein [Salinivirgaceae bacterium]|jgi:uncharacterized membrane protein|nr:DUF502 domain-containing protein [Salinivirgaceae bacterium]
MKKLVAYFLQGVLYIAPLAITGYIIYRAFTIIDGSIQTFIFSLIGMQIPGLGIILLFLFLTLLGVLGSTILAQPFKWFFGTVINKTPVVKVIYSSFRDLFSAFAGKDKKFDKPVLVKADNNADFYRTGFITETDLSKINLINHVAVYFPSSYGVLGEMLIVPKDKIKHIDIPPTDVMKFIVSGGVAGWDKEEGERSKN